MFTKIQYRGGGGGGIGQFNLRGQLLRGRTDFQIQFKGAAWQERVGW